jgi:hypothetical protein
MVGFGVFEVEGVGCGVLELEGVIEGVVEGVNGIVGFCV